MNAWQQWLQHPEKLRAREFLFQIHFWMGAMAAPYVLLMSLTGAAIVLRNQIPAAFHINGLVRLHSELLSGNVGRIANGIGGISTTLLCLTGAVIWWPGVQHWRRSLSVSWGAHFPRISWDLHSALGFWCLPFVLLWGVSGFYLAVPRAFDALYAIDPRDRYTDPFLYWLSRLHFGRFAIITEIIWTIVGLAPAILAFTGAFICCRRVLYKKPSNPKLVVE